MDPEENAEPDSAAEVEVVEGEESTTVVVDVPAPEEAEVVEVTDEGDSTVIVEAPEAGASEAEVDRWIEVERRLGEQDRRIDALSQVAVAAVETAVEAEAEAEDASDTAEGVEALVAEAEAEDAQTPEDDGIKPASARVHPLFRSRGQWKEARADK